MQLWSRPKCDACYNGNTIPVITVTIGKHMSVCRFQHKLHPLLVTHAPQVFLSAMEMADLVHSVAKKACDTVSQYLRSTKKDDAPYVVVDFPVTLFMLRSKSDLQLASLVTETLTFSPEIHAMAQQVRAF